MTLKECYNALGGDYQDVMARFRSEARVIRFIRLFPEEPCFNDLLAAMAANDREEAFRAAHSMKGICLNMGFTRLYAPSMAATEALRAGNIEKAATFLPKMEKEYRAVVQAIHALDAK